MRIVSKVIKGSKTKPLSLKDIVKAIEEQADKQHPSFELVSQSFNRHQNDVELILLFKRREF